MPANTFSIGVILRDFRLGGSERVAIGLANQWHALGFAVTVFVGRAVGDMQGLLHPAIPIQTADLSPHIPDRALGAKTARAAGRYFYAHPVKACYVPGNGHWPVTRRLSLLPFPIRPILVTQVSSPIFKKGRTALGQWLYNMRMRFLLRHSDHVVTISRTLAQQTQSVLKRGDIAVIPLPVVWEPSPPKPIPTGTQHILAAGRLVPVKGFDLLIRAIALVRQHVPNIHLTLCGTGPEQAKLQALIHDLGLHAQVTLVGYVPCIRPWLDQCRAFVLSSHAESYAAVLVEALAAGRQVISTDCTPAVEELLHTPQAGAITPVGNVQAMAEAIVRVLGTAPPCGASLASLVQPFHLSHGAMQYLSLMARYRHDPMPETADTADKKRGSQTVAPSCNPQAQ
ncbi:MAG: glycosyltransferase [Acetobacter sp.]